MIPCPNTASWPAPDLNNWSRQPIVDGDNLTHFITGGPYAYKDTSVYDTIVTKSPGLITSRIIWQTSCLDPREQPYLITIKTEDHNPELSLIDIDNLNIRVLAPAPMLV